MYSPAPATQLSISQLFNQSVNYSNNQLHQVLLGPAVQQSVTPETVKSEIWLQLKNREYD